MTRMAEGPAMISLSTLRFSYDDRARTLFNGLSLEIPAGSITAILGPNGAGKSTLLHLILGMLKPHAGSVRLDGRARHTYSRRELGRLVGLVAQTESIPFSFTVMDYVLLGRAPYLRPLEVPGPEDVRVAERALVRLGIDAMARRAIDTLSGGEQQLVVLARALAQQPRILLLDEPTAHLDLGNKGRVLHLVQEMVADGITVVFTTHEPDLVAAIADYVVLMRGGETLAAGALSDVFTPENLSQTYGVPVTVAQVAGRRVVVA